MFKKYLVLVLYLFFLHIIAAQGPPDILSFNSSYEALTYWNLYSAIFKPLNQSNPAGPQRLQLTGSQYSDEGAAFSNVGISINRETIHAVDQMEAYFSFTSTMTPQNVSGIAFMFRPDAPPTNTSLGDMEYRPPIGSPNIPGVVEVHFQMTPFQNDTIAIYLDRDFSKPRCLTPIPEGLSNKIVNVWLGYSKPTNNTMYMTWNFGSENWDKRPNQILLTCPSITVPTLNPHVGFLAQAGDVQNQQSILATEMRTCGAPNVFYNLTSRACQCLPGFVPVTSGCQVPGYNEGLSAGAIAGIVVGVVCGVALIAGIAAVIAIRKKQAGQLETMEKEFPMEYVDGVEKEGGYNAPPMPKGVETSVVYSVLPDKSEINDVAVKQYESFMENLKKSRQLDQGITNQEVKVDSGLGGLCGQL